LIIPGRGSEAPLPVQRDFKRLKQQGLQSLSPVEIIARKPLITGDLIVTDESI
jgi:hypothetical protein